jgi:hypothetical protein
MTTGNAYKNHMNQMKITPEHYNYMKRAIDALTNDRIEDAKKIAGKKDLAKDVAKFYRWQLFAFAGLSSYACDTLYKYLDDTHIDTALKNIVKDLKIGI